MRKNDQKRSAKIAQRRRRKDIRRKSLDARLAHARKLGREARAKGPRFRQDVLSVTKQLGLSSDDLKRIGITDLLRQSYADDQRIDALVGRFFGRRYLENKAFYGI